MRVAPKSTKPFQSFARLGFIRLMVALAAVVLLAAAGIYYMAKPTLSSSAYRDEPTSSAEPTETQIRPQGTQSPATVQQLPADAAETDGDGSNSDAAPVDNSPTSQNVTPACANKTEQLEKKYHQDIEKEKKSLDVQLGFPPVGANISIMYIEVFNDRIKELHETYVRSAQDASCVFPVDQPDFLPLNYPG